MLFKKGLHDTFQIVASWKRPYLNLGQKLMIDPEIFFMNHLTLLLFKRETDCYFHYIKPMCFNRCTLSCLVLHTGIFYSCICKLCGQETICTYTPNNCIKASIHYYLHFPHVVSAYTWLKPIIITDSHQYYLEVAVTSSLKLKNAWILFTVFLSLQLCSHHPHETKQD